jgi:hypothetical protein
MYTPQEVCGTLSVEDGLVVRAGAELVEWYQICETHCFDVFDAIPFPPSQTFYELSSPQQPPVVHTCTPKPVITLSLVFGNRNSNLKTLLAIGGWKFGSQP